MKVQIFLKTPLFKGSYGPDHDRELTESIIEVTGTATARDGGLEVEVSELRNARRKVVEAPFQRIFLPASKVDYYVITDAT